ncbi:hypothetical protein WW83_24045, partial [Salmonella enterica subsp. enterica serovar Kentucky]|nr:hypothetical protein [Salmonella enterica subsp. enterica serovar Kentucky]
MLGFVSALSATLAIIVLIASVMLVNLLSLSIDKKNKDYHLQYMGVKENRSDTDKNKPRDSDLMFSNNIISIKYISQHLSNISEIDIGCSYGNNYNYDVASKLLSINYVILVKYYTPRGGKVNLIKPSYDKNSINKCW